VTSKKNNSAILLIHCPDQKGLVIAITEFIYKNGGNILHLDQHVDQHQSVFFMRVEWDLSEFTIPVERISEYFETLVASHFQMDFEVHFSRETPRMALFVSKLSHCFHDLLARYETGELEVEIPIIISNHEDMRPVAERLGIEFEMIRITKENKQEQEARQLQLLAERKVDFVVLARYMQILSEQFIEAYPQRIINIHHSFLPAFPGAKPYHSAYQRGVKIIGATSHYVTTELDAGPIIEQDVCRVSHEDAVEDMVRKGRDLEKIVLARAVWHHLHRNVLVYDNRTVVFA